MGLFDPGRPLLLEGRSEVGPIIRRPLQLERPWSTRKRQAGSCLSPSTSAMRHMAWSAFEGPPPRNKRKRILRVHTNIRRLEYFIPTLKGSHSSVKMDELLSAGI